MFLALTIKFYWLLQVSVIYQWELFAVLQVKEVAPEARRRDAALSFAFVYPDKRGRFVVKEVSSLATCMMHLCICEILSFYIVITSMLAISIRQYLHINYKAAIYVCMGIDLWINGQAIVCCCCLISADSSIGLV